MSVAVLLERLIDKKYYTDKKAIENKLNIFYAMSKITDEEYSNLIFKLEEVYFVEITETEEVVENVNNTEESEVQE